MAINEAVARAFDFIRGRKQAYQITFSRNSIHAQLVLQDLAKFCRASESVFNEDQRLTDVLIGRNEVWKRIQDHLNLEAHDLYRLAAGQQLQLKDDNNE